MKPKGVPYKAYWRLDAGGTLGKWFGGQWPRYISTAWAGDPWPITPESLPNPEDPYFDLYIPVGLLGGKSTVGEYITGGYSLSVSYETAGEITSLLGIAASGHNVSVTGPPPGLSVSYYLLEGEDSDPTTIGPVLSASQLQGLLAADLVDSRIDTPLYLGIFWDDVPTPGRGLRDEALALVHVDTAVDEAATIPEPSGLALLALCGLVGLRRRMALLVRSM